MSNKIELPERFVIPEDRIPKPWSQGLYGVCGYASITKVAEVWNYRRTGEYKMMSKFYTAGRHASPNLKNFKTSSGIDYDYTLNCMLTRGTVPEEMCPVMNDIPYIMDDIANLPNLAEIDKEAEKTKIKSFTRIPGNGYFRDNVKKYLYEQQMPLIGNVTSRPHSVVIVGWDGNDLLCHDHDGSDRIVRMGCNGAYAIEGYLDEPIDIPEEPIELPEATEIPDILAILVSAGIVTNVELWRKKCTDDVNVYWLCRKTANYLIKKG